MLKLLAELKQRQMFRVAAAYAVVAWLLLQIVNNVAPVLDLPPWVARAFLLLLVIGFPIALLFVWMHELAPTDGAAARTATTRLDYVLVGALVLVIGLVSYQQLASNSGATIEQQASLTPPSGQVTPDGIAVAVLPFVNLSTDQEQEFFSDGMTDEIITALTKVSELRVVGRESAFQFKGQRADMRAIGQALGAGYLIAGSVRRSGDQVRISVQLTRADNGVNLWAESYDRELKDIFAIQSDIAQAIAGALKVPLGLQQGKTLVANRTGDIESYQEYLRARALVRVRNNDAIPKLEGVVARDPNFAPAWALLARAYQTAPEYRTGSVEDARRELQTAADKAEKSAQEAIRLDSGNAVAYAVLATIESRRGRFVAAEDIFKQALALDPNDPEVLQAYGSMLGSVGRGRDYLAVSEKLVDLEPFVPGFKISLAVPLSMLGSGERLKETLEALPRDFADGVVPNSMLAYVYAEAGRYTEAADLLLATRTGGVSRQSVEDAARLLRSAPTKVAAPEALPTLEGPLSFVYAYIGALDRVLEYAERNNAIGAYRTTTVWVPLYAPLRKTERFKRYARDAGLVDYWRARGWPDLCRPVGIDDFVCD